jgi:HAD superfamily phosphatase (TIGR01668 family)
MKPDLRFSRIEEIPVTDLLRDGVQMIFVDIDNTIVEPEREEPGATIRQWFEEAKKAGMEIVLLSNSVPSRLVKIASSLGVRGVLGLKPFPYAMKRILRESGIRAEKAVFIGDQILTDYLAALLCGIRMFLVKPLSQKEFFLTRLISRPAEAMLKWLLKIEP